MKSFVSALSVAAALLPFAAEAAVNANIDAGIAERLVKHCEAHAQSQKLALAIVVLDGGGHPVLAKRMDGARFTTMEIAEGKARAALSLGAPSGMLQDAIDKGKVSYLTVPGVIAIRGGLPIMRDGVVIGAMGASGALEAQDELCVKSAIDAVK